MKYIVLLLFVLGGVSINAQTDSFIEGQLLDGQTQEEIRFAKVYNYTLKKGTITDDEGFFTLPVASDTDEIQISYVGYEKQMLLYQLPSLENQKYFLTQKLQLIDEVFIFPSDMPFLYTLINRCKKKSSYLKSKGKAVYELKSFMDEDQIELVEGYYNFESMGYDLDQLDLKTGRLGVQFRNEKMFVSLESSRAIAMQSVLKENQYFPSSPFEFSARKMKKYFSLQLMKKYLDDNQDSIFVINYRPRSNKGYLFEGTLWLNKTTKDILKVVTNCVDCQRHPFLPIFPSDTIVKLDMFITRTFRNEKGQMGFNHVNFNYDIQYKSRNMTIDAIEYSVKTQAVLYGFDFDQEFNLPHFEFEDDQIGDYRKVNAIPYDDFFWEYNDEDRFADRKDQNKKFMEEKATIESRTLFSPNAFFSKGLLEHPYKKWSPNRFIFREKSPPAQAKQKSRMTSSVGYLGPVYSLKVRVFADINTYADSTNIITATVFDPYESFSLLPQNAQTHCFINMYFDLHEIGRLMFLSEIKRKKIATEDFDAFYETFFRQMELDAKQFLKEVERGRNEENMKKWNSFIFQNLGIDNMAMFKPFEIKEE